MKTFKRFLIAFLAITGSVAIATGVFGVEFGRSDFWDHHGILFLFFVTLFPRLTLLLGGVATGGVLWWLGWIFAPHMLVAVLATLVYWHQNPVLVVLAWLVALGGESSEKYAVMRQSRSKWSQHGGYDSAKWVNVDVENQK